MPDDYFGDGSQDLASALVRAMQQNPVAPLQPSSSGQLTSKPRRNDFLGQLSQDPTTFPSASLLSPDLKQRLLAAIQQSAQTQADLLSAANQPLPQPPPTSPLPVSPSSALRRLTPRRRGVLPSGSGLPSGPGLPDPNGYGYGY